MKSAEELVKEYGASLGSVCKDMTVQELIDSHRTIRAHNIEYMTNNRAVINAEVAHRVKIENEYLRTAVYVKVTDLAKMSLAEISALIEAQRED